MIHVATYGKPDTAMPGFQKQLPVEDITAVVDYVRTAFVPPLPAEGVASLDQRLRVTDGATLDATGKVDMTLPLPKGLVGDPDRGIALYLMNCSACHGADGDGQGPRAYFILPKPRNFHHPASRETYNRPALYKAIARGRLGAEMPAWDTVFDDQQIADVAEYVYRAFIRPDRARADVGEADRL
jgi:mono/diheme cytochrome c family protein